MQQPGRLHYVQPHTPHAAHASHVAPYDPYAPQPTHHHVHHVRSGGWWWWGCAGIACLVFFFFLLLAVAWPAHDHDHDHDHDHIYTITPGRHGGVGARARADGSFECPPGDAVWTTPTGDAICRPDVVLPTGVHGDMIDKNAEPCGNFYQHANGAWLASGISGEWSRFFSPAERFGDALIDDVLQGAVGVSPWMRNPLGDVLRACVSAHTAPDAAADRAVLDELRASARIAAHRGPLAAAGAWLARGLPAPIDVSVVVSPAESGQRALLIAPGHDIFAHIPHHLRREFVLALFRGDESRARAALAIAEVLSAAGARASIDALDMAAYVRNPSGWAAHTFTADALARAVPSLDWTSLRDALFGANAARAAALTHWVLSPSHLATLANLQASTDDWAAYYEMLALSATFEHLPSTFSVLARSARRVQPVSAARAFGHGALNRTTLGRWTRPRAVRHHHYALGAATGAPTALPNAEASERCRQIARASMADVIDDALARSIITPALRARFEAHAAAAATVRLERIARSPRLSPAAKAFAKAKVEGMRIRLGVPNDPRGPVAAQTEFTAHHASNMLALLAGRAGRHYADVVLPFDAWRDALPADMTDVANAYYSPSDNTVLILNDMIVPPFSDDGYDDVAFAATVGSIFEHEVSHGFDPSGILYDANGAVARPLAPPDVAAFDDWAACIAAVYTGRDPSTGVAERGIDTRTEASADVHGITIALAATERTLGRSLTTAELRRFAQVNAQMWAQVQSHAAAERQAHGDPHPLASFRVNNQLAQAGVLERAFECLAPEQRCMPVL